MLPLKLKVKLEKHTFSLHQKEKSGCSTSNITRTQISLLLNSITQNFMNTAIFKHVFCLSCSLPSSDENEHLIILKKQSHT